MTAETPALRLATGARVEFSEVRKAYGTIGALRGISLAIEPGEVFGIIGRSGAGKSTLLRLINGLERPTEGCVLVNGTDVGRLPASGLPALRRRIGMIFQGFNLLSAKTVAQNVALPLRLAGVPKAIAHKRALEVLDLVGLADKHGVYPATLSGGQKQRVGIARALVQRPDLLLSDEATSALDPETTQSILALLKDINRQFGVTIVLITHEMEVIRQIADRVAVLERGEIVETGPVWQVFGDPQHDASRAILRLPDGTLPEDIQPDPARILFEIDYTGTDARDPDLFALASILGPGARLLHGGVDRIQGRTQGRLLIGVPRADLDSPRAALARLRTVAPKAEIVTPTAESVRHVR